VVHIRPVLWPACRGATPPLATHPSIQIPLFEKNVLYSTSVKQVTLQKLLIHSNVGMFRRDSKIFVPSECTFKYTKILANYAVKMLWILFSYEIFQLFLINLTKCISFLHILNNSEEHHKKSMPRRHHCATYFLLLSQTI
jgi:hypothetical protein